MLKIIANLWSRDASCKFLKAVQAHVGVCGISLFLWYLSLCLSLQFQIYRALAPQYLVKKCHSIFKKWIKSFLRNFLFWKASQNLQCQIHKRKFISDCSPCICMVILSSAGHTQQGRSWLLCSRRHPGLLDCSIHSLLCHECCALLSWFLMSVSSLFLSVLALLCLSRSHAVWFQGSLPGKNFSWVLTFVRLVDFGQSKSLKGDGNFNSETLTFESLFCHWLSAPLLFLYRYIWNSKRWGLFVFQSSLSVWKWKLIGSGS